MGISEANLNRPRRAESAAAEDEVLPQPVALRLAALERDGLESYATQRHALCALCGTPGVGRIRPLALSLVTDSVQLTVEVLFEGQLQSLLIAPSGRVYSTS